MTNETLIVHRLCHHLMKTLKMVDVHMYVCMGVSVWMYVYLFVYVLYT